MSLLLEPAPVTVVIGGAEVGIETDFRASVRFELMMQEEDLSDEAKVLQALQLYYGTVPKAVPEAVEKMLWFYHLGREDSEAAGTRGRLLEPVYSFEHDDGYIYAAFLTQYRIDLQNVPYLHWWSFKRLFDSLSPENEFVKIMQYRAAEITPKMSREQQDFYRRMKKLYALPLPKREREQLSALEEALLGSGDVSALLNGKPASP